VIRQQAPDGSEFDRVLEVGSGTGRISAALARDGRRVCLLDTSAHALQIARNVFHQSRTRGDFVRASGMHLPFHDGSFDLVWSAGLLEHFPATGQRRLVLEMIRILREGGMLLVLVPHRRAVVYDLSRRLAMRMGTWPYGPEEPMTTRDLADLGFQSQNTRSAGLFYQLNFLTLIPLLARVVPRFTRTTRWFLGNRYFDTSGRFGYLLFGTIRKLTPDPTRSARSDHLR
jgi:SAM-dependent methyltransferase